MSYIQLPFSFPLSPSAGGTGITSYTAGDMLYALNSSTLAKLPIGTSGQVLTVSGGFPVWGAAPASGVAIGDVITGGTTGSILFIGAASVLAQDNANFFWDDTNNRLGIGTTTPQMSIDSTSTSIGATASSTQGLMLANATAAANGAQQFSPSLIWRGRGWKTTATAASQTVDFRAHVSTFQGTTAPSGQWTLSSSINGGAYAFRFSVSTSGLVSMDSMSVQNGTISNLTASSTTLTSTTTLGGFIPGSVLFVGSVQEIQQSNDNFFWSESGSASKLFLKRASHTAIDDETLGVDGSTNTVDQVQNVSGTINYGQPAGYPTAGTTHTIDVYAYDTVLGEVIYSSTPGSNSVIDNNSTVGVQDPTGGSATQNFGSAGYYIDNSDTRDFRIYAYRTTPQGIVYSVTPATGGFTEGGTTNPYSVDLSWTAAGDAEGYYITRQVNGGGFNDYLDVGNVVTYNDTNTGWNGGANPTPTSRPDTYTIDWSWDAITGADGYIVNDAIDVRYRDEGTNSFTDDDTGWTAGTPTLTPTSNFNPAASFNGDVLLDGNIVPGADGVSIGTASSDKISFYGVDTVAQYNTVGATGFSVGTGTGVLSGSFFSGGFGATSYTINDIVACLKLLGAMAP